MTNEEASQLRDMVNNWRHMGITPTVCADELEMMVSMQLEDTHKSSDALMR